MLVGAGALACHRRGDRGGRQAWRRLRQGVARQSCAAGRSALGDRLDRPARHQAKLRPDERMRHAADDRLGLSLRRVPAEGRPGQRRPDRPRARHAEPALSDGGQPRRRQRRDAPRAVADAEAEVRVVPGARRLPGWTRTWWETLEGRAMAEAKPINPQRVAWELSPRLPDKAIITSDFRLLRQLVRARSENPPRHEMLAVRRARLDGRGGALRHRRQDGLSRSAGDRAGRRRRDADEQHGRADHGRQILARLAKSDLDLRGVEQRGPQSGDVGAARHGGRSQVRGVAEHSKRALSQVRRADRAQRHLCRPGRSRRGRLGRGAARRPARC